MEARAIISNGNTSSSSIIDDNQNHRIRLVSNNTQSNESELTFETSENIESNNPSAISRLSQSKTYDTSKVIYEADVDFYTKEMLRLIKLDDFEDGEVGAIHELFDQLLTTSEYLFNDCFQNAWLTLYRQSDYIYFYTFLCAASSIEYKLFQNNADCILFAALALNNEELNEGAIRAIDSWAQKEHIELLENIRSFDIPWLEDYRKEVISNLRDLHA